MKDHHCRNRPKLRLARLLAGLSALAFLSASPGHAQGIPGIAGTRIDPSILQSDEMQDREKREAENRQLQPTPATGETIRQETDASQPEGLLPENDPRFVLREILISGVTVFNGKTLEEKFSPWIDREVNYSDLLRIAGDINKLYHDNGYITTRAVLPPQDIENGVVSIHVIEGKIGEIRVEGNQHIRDRYITARLHQKEGEVFRLQTLQKDMLHLSGDSLLDKAHATLKTGTKAGTSDLLLEIKDHQPIHLMIGVDNMGRNGIGLWRHSYTLSHENLLGYGDSAIVNATLASHTTAAFGQYKFPVGHHGWFTGGNYSFTHVNAGETGNSIRIGDETEIRTITGDSHRFSAFMEFPVYRSLLSRRWDINGNVSLNFIDSMTYLDGTSLKAVEYEAKKRNPLTQVEKFSSIRSITSRLNISEQDKTGRWLLGTGITTAMTWLGGNEAFAKFNTELTRVQALPWGMIGLLKAEGQFTPNRLPYAEKMQMGGASTVRGYSEGYLIADSGYLLSAELRYPLNFLPKSLRDEWQGLFFVEHGRLLTQGKGPVNTIGKPGSLLGYGIGIRGRLTRYLNARLDLGLAGTRRDRQPDVRAHFSLNSQLF